MIVSIGAISLVTVEHIDALSLAGYSAEAQM